MKGACSWHLRVPLPTPQLRTTASPLAAFVLAMRDHRQTVLCLSAQQVTGCATSSMPLGRRRAGFQIGPIAARFLQDVRAA